MLEWFLEIIKKFGAIILSVLPTSPFDKYLDSLGNLDYLGYLNWFIPVGSFIKMGNRCRCVLHLQYNHALG